MSKFIQSALKTLFVLTVIFTGTVGLLAAKNFERKLDAAVQEIALVRRDAEVKLSAANEELAEMQRKAEAEMAALRLEVDAAHELMDTALEAAAKWKGKFATLCSMVEQAADDAAFGTMSVLKQ
jgi:hypothetical protein